MAQMVKNLPAMQETMVQSLVGKMTWRRQCPPTLVFLPGEFHEHKSLACYSPWGRKELDTTDRMNWAQNKLIIRGCYEQLYANKLDNLEMDKFLELCKLNHEETKTLNKPNTS